MDPKTENGDLSDIDATYSSLYHMAEAYDRAVKCPQLAPDVSGELKYIAGEVNALRQRLVSVATNLYGRAPMRIHPASSIPFDPAKHGAPTPSIWDRVFRRGSIHRPNGVDNSLKGSV